MGFWDESGYDDSWHNAEPGGFAGGRGGAPMPGPADENPAGASDDPFAYTKGSLLTPWEGHFDGSKYGGGGSGVAEYHPFQYADFDYRAPNPGSFDERYNDPGDFKYGDYTGQAPFKGVTAKDMRADPGTQLREQRAMKVLQASKAAQGVLKTGGTLKAMQKNASDLASDEYGAVYNRKRGEYDLAEDQSRFRYGTNRNNAKDSFDTNVGNARTGYQLRQATWKGNADTALASGELGFRVASGAYDRNFAKARQGYDDQASHDQAVASAGAAGANRAYDRALDEYKMSRDEFYTNQDRQYNILDHEDMKGRDAAAQYAGYSGRYADASAENALGRGNAQASGRVGSGNAWASAAGNIGNSVMDYAMYTARPGSRTAAARPRTVGSVAPTNYYETHH